MRPRALPGELRQGRADHPLLGGEVHRQGRLPGRLVVVAAGGLKQAHPGVVHQDVETPEARHDLAHHLRDAPGVLHVELPGRRRSPRLLDLLGDPGNPLAVAIHDGDPHPLVGEELGGGAPDPARRSGDERDLARDPAVQLAETSHRADQRERRNSAKCRQASVAVKTPEIFPPSVTITEPMCRSAISLRTRSSGSSRSTE